MKALKGIEAKFFFPRYTKIKSYTHKMRGRNGMGQPIQFTKEEMNEIRAGIVLMIRDILKKLPNKN